MYHGTKILTESISSAQQGHIMHCHPLLLFWWTDLIRISLENCNLRGRILKVRITSLWSCGLQGHTEGQGITAWAHIPSSNSLKIDCSNSRECNLVCTLFLLLVLRINICAKSSTVKRSRVTFCLGKTHKLVALALRVENSSAISLIFDSLSCAGQHLFKDVNLDKDIRQTLLSFSCAG